MKVSRCSRYHLLVLVLSMVLWGCASQNTSGTLTNKSRYAGVLEKARIDKRSMMLHSGINLYTITNVQVDKAHRQFTVQLDMPDSIHRTDANNAAVGTATPNAAGQSGSARLHVHMSDSISYTLDEPHTLSMDKVAKMVVE
ncbi:MAG TPA: hypothetical protein VEZ17_06225 [Chitinophagaceae bacterium]|nr:hypothetical protein [Chitinophagaceae bacterium]